MWSWYNSGVKNWLKGLGLSILIWVLIVFIAAWLAYTIAILKSDQQLSSAYVAVGTLILAFVTALLAYFTWQSVKSGYEREKRDRKERLLNEIMGWAEDAARLNFKIYNFIEAQISKETWVESGIGEIVSEFQVVEAKGVYINSIALSSFKEGKKLSGATKAVNKEIRELVDVSIKRLDGEVTSENVSEHMNLLRTKITKLLKETAKIKTEVI